MQGRAVIAICCLVPGLFLAAAGIRAAHPNNSIDPQPPPPTRYGLTIVRADDQRFTDVQPDPVPPAGPVVDYLAAVSRTERERGPYSSALVDPLAEAARAFQLAGRHRYAIRYFKRALHLTRLNAGLYDVSQLPLLDQLSASQIALGQLEAADHTRDYLYRVQREHYPPGDRDLLQAAIAHTHWKREAYLEGFGNDTFVHLLDIHRLHSQVVDRIAESDKYSPAQIPHLYERMRSEYLMSRYEGEAPPVFKVHGSGFTGNHLTVNTSLDRERFRVLKKHNFRNGRMTMERIVKVLKRQRPPDLSALTQAQIALGDCMWWDQPARARQCYEEAYALWDQDGIADTDPAALFRQPVELPEDEIFQPGGLSLEPKMNARAVVRFDVSRLGQVLDIEYLEVEAESEDKTEHARLALHRMLRDFRFRPIVRNGEVVAADNLVREYHFEY